MTNRIDIFEVLKKVDSFDLAYFNGLTPEERKGISPYTLMLWMGGCKSPIQLRQLNVFMNSMVFDLPAGHHNLLLKLACISSDGKQKKYHWVKKSTNSKKFTTTVGVLKRFYKCSTERALSYVPLIDYAFVENIAMDLGEQPDTLATIKKELK